MLFQNWINDRNFFDDYRLLALFWNSGFLSWISRYLKLLFRISSHWHKVFLIFRCTSSCFIRFLSFYQMFIILIYLCLYEFNGLLFPCCFIYRTIAPSFRSEHFRIEIYCTFLTFFDLTLYFILNHIFIHNIIPITWYHLIKNLTLFDQHFSLFKTCIQITYILKSTSFLFRIHHLRHIDLIRRDMLHLIFKVLQLRGQYIKIGLIGFLILH